MRASDDKALDHAWAYFALHANQRLTVFNYFVVLAGVLGAGIGAAIQASPRFALIGVVLGLLLVLLSFVFWKIDQRTSFLIKHAEAELAKIEPESGPIVAGAESKTASAKASTGLWTYGRALRLIFIAMAAIGIGGVILSGLRAADLLEFGSDKSTQSQVAPPR